MGKKQGLRNRGGGKKKKEGEKEAGKNTKWGDGGHGEE